MRDNIESIGDEEKHKKFFQLLTLMAEYDEAEPADRQAIVEEIRILKKELVKTIEGFEEIECVVAGDKDADKAEVVLCADATPDNVFRVKGTIEVPCSKCGKAVLFSPDSPKGPPKVCYDCAKVMIAKQKETDEQDSFGV